MTYKRVPIIKKMVINELRSYQDHSGEYNSVIDIDFILEEKCSFDIYNEKYEIDRVKMVDYYDEIGLVFANLKEQFRDFIVPKSFIHQILKIVEVEENDGKLKEWCFSEDLHEILIGENDSKFYYG